MAVEQPMEGGVSGAVRVGGTVHRPTGAWSPAVHALLRHLEGKGFDGAPRVLGTDEADREILTYIPGETVLSANSWTSAVARDELLYGVGRLICRYHDAVRDFRPPPGTVWRSRRGGAGPGEVICHNDLAPRNAICRETTAAAFIDWDFAAPHPADWDVAHAAWQFVPLQQDELCLRLGWASPPDRRSRFRLFCEACGTESPAHLLTVVRARIAASRDGIRRLAEAGEPAFVKLRSEGHDADMDQTISFLGQIARELLTP